MSIKGFNINGVVQKYDYNELDNKPTIPSGGGVSDELKTALLQLASKVAYIDENGSTYYQDLYDALYAAPSTLTSISASFTQTSPIYTTDAVTDIPSRGTLVVTAHYSDSPDATISSGYTLSGTLTAGTSTITVTYSGKTTTFTVTVTAVAGTYTVDNTGLVNCTTSNNASTVTGGTSYSATITAASGYTLTGATVSITMGNTNITSTAYNNGVISIASVTGDIVIAITAVVYSTAPRIAYVDKALKNDGTLANITGACVTEYYTYTLDIAAAKLTTYYDSTNDYMTQGSHIFKLKYSITNPDSVSFSGYRQADFIDKQGTQVQNSTETTSGDETALGDVRYKTEWLHLEDNVINIAFTLTTAGAATSYAYWVKTAENTLPIGVSDGDIIFAGASTQYYGKHNIND